VPRFATFDGIELAYDDEGDPGAARAVVLLHGFAADTSITWRRTGIAAALAEAGGRRVVALDARGHGRSDKPHRAAAYQADAMAADVRALLDHLSLSQVDLVGYSMGALTALRMLPGESRVGRAVLGGIGESATRRPPASMAAVADGLEADDPASITDPTARAFRRLADATGADRIALAAVQRGWRSATNPPLDTGRITARVLVVTGDRDHLAGPAEALAARLPHADAMTVAGDHDGALASPAFRRAILDFLATPAPPATPRRRTR
jgi:pimeloyl-ACP methyl ester carboxylesterase